MLEHLTAQLHRIAASLRSLSQVRMPVGLKTPDLSSSQKTFGPFYEGDVVRVFASGNAWAFMTPDEDHEMSDGDGIAVAAWDRHDYEVVDHARVFVVMALDSGSASGRGRAFRIGRIDRDRA